MFSMPFGFYRCAPWRLVQISTFFANCMWTVGMVSMGFSVAICSILTDFPGASEFDGQHCEDFGFLKIESK